MEELLQDYLRFIEDEADSDEVFDPDVKISEQFDKVLDEMDFRIATIKFEMHAMVDIPRTPKNYDLTLRELVSKISELSKVCKANVPTFLKKKKAQLARIAQEMAAELNSMFG